ncbi:Acyl-coenzyme A thioesterase PaaI, contains HGG motif [Modestobacter sp. DSM 44400]|uniref:PaaI family thioesterase n=1 Tax=Modestobacter sp. DSM 44400 TaxID=1550230 RepID=UPI0008968029|nr:PaaI family thioesterase [Modestobacter sp. DSM 44400]SDY36932.1 Acyl-coenzyme A thioesterase PaaI, contains HGG motif [Modestobacter sp. DSM 44400]
MVEPLAGPSRDRRRAAVGELGTALRELVDAAVRTEVDETELAAVQAVVREQTARLRAVSRDVTAIPAVDDPETGERWYSPVYGPGNPLAPPLEVTASADGRVTARVTVGKAHEGPPGLVHGGVIATLLDHVLARAPRSAGHNGLTGSLTVRYRRPVPLVLEAHLESLEGRHATARATLVAADDTTTVLAEGEALLVALRAERAAEVFAATGRAVAAWTERATD